MSFLDMAKKRFSVRQFSDQPVEKEKLEKILEAGRWAPTGCNKQPQKIYVLQSPLALDKIRAITPCAFNAPVVLLVCVDKKQAWQNVFIKGHDSAEMDASIIGTHFMMEALELGLGSTWVLYFDPEQVKTAFHLPDNLSPSFLLPIGYPEQGVVPHEMHQREPLEKMVEYL